MGFIPYGRTVIKPPERFSRHMNRAPFKYKYNPSVFLAGSIEGGTAEQWQRRVEIILEDTDWTILNPRNDNWDATLRQDKDEPKFREQVEWELVHLNLADVILFYFAPDTKAPITLMELGLFGATKPEKCLVVCPKPYWRKGNVDIVCESLGIKQFNTLEDATDELGKILHRLSIYGSDS